MHADDAVDAVDGFDAGRPMIDRFDRRLRLDGGLSDTERTALLRIADRCPVHRTLSNGSTIVTSLNDE